METSLILLGLFALAAGIGIGVVFSRSFTPQKSKPAQEGASQQTALLQQAAKILERAGYKIREEQKRANLNLSLDSQAHFGCVTADFLAEKGNKKFVACVKEKDFDITDPILIRELLGYDYIFAPDGLLIVDINNDRVREVSFEVQNPEDSARFFKLLVAATIIITMITILWIMVQLRLF